VHIKTAPGTAGSFAIAEYRNKARNRTSESDAKGHHRRQEWRQGRYDLNRLKEAILLLIANKGPLGPEWCDHALRGDWDGHRECHIGGDFLLAYKLDDKGKSGLVIFVEAVRMPNCSSNKRPASVDRRRRESDSAPATVTCTRLVTHVVRTPLDQRSTS
jgi:addiction module RelE/StbE family toxin